MSPEPATLSAPEAAAKQAPEKKNESPAFIMLSEHEAVALEQRAQPPCLLQGICRHHQHTVGGVKGA